MYGVSFPRVERREELFPYVNEFVRYLEVLRPKSVRVRYVRTNDKEGGRIERLDDFNPWAAIYRRGRSRTTWAVIMPLFREWLDEWWFSEIITDFAYVVSRGLPRGLFMREVWSVLDRYGDFRPGWRIRSTGTYALVFQPVGGDTTGEEEEWA